MEKNERKKIINNLDMVEILNQLHEGFSICDENGYVLYITENNEQVFGKKIEEVLGARNCETGVTKNPISDTVIQSKKKILSRQESQFGDELLVTGVPIFDKQGNLKYSVVYNSWNFSDEDELIRTYMSRFTDKNSISPQLKVIDSSKKHNYDFFVAKSYKMMEVIKTIQKAQEYSVGVFISGEKGVGKNYLAGYYHFLSDRSDKSLIFFDPNDLDDISEEEALFGMNDKKGYLEICNGGTLVITSVENIHFSVQRALAYFMKTGKFIDVLGNEKEAEVNLVFISSQSAQMLHKTRRICNELYYQVGKIEVTIPPLRQRMEDLDEFIEHYLKLYNNQYHKNITIDNKAKGALLGYYWPENVREVRFVMEQIVLSTEDDVVGIYDLPNVIADSYYGSVEVQGDLKTMLEYYEKKIIKETYTRCKTSVALAKELNISQASASRKIAKYIEE